MGSDLDPDDPCDPDDPGYPYDPDEKIWIILEQRAYLQWVRPKLDLQLHYPLVLSALKEYIIVMLIYYFMRKRRD